jgi:hypothetical protein
MTTMHERHRRQLTGGVLRLSNATLSLAPDCLVTRSPPSSWAGLVEVSDINREVGWDGNRPFVSVKASILRTVLAGCQHGLGLYELARSARGYSVALATLTRGAIEAYGRVDWLLSAETPDQLIGRHGSMEYSDQRYPSQHRQVLQVEPPSPRSGMLAADYRETIRQFLETHNVAMEKCSPGELANKLLGEIYNEPDLIYSGLSATAHGLGWATTNFFSVNSSNLIPDDQMLIEYCAYVIETTTRLCDRLVEVFVPAQAVADRWTQVRDQVNSELSYFIVSRDQLLSS